MNPAVQDMKALLFMLPRIWKMEERVVGADLGLGRFQFDFDQEDDIQEVLKMEPYHFDHWMLSLVRWEPVVDSRYPCLIKFWVRVMGVPLHFWADETFRTIGADLGEVEEVDLDNGRVKVLLNGFKSLIFEATVEFHSGEETTISLRYERLYGFCRRCNSFCHDTSRCPLFGDKGKQRLDDSLPPRPEDKLQSYKGAMVNGGANGTGSGLSGVGSGASHQSSAHGTGRGVGHQAGHYRANQSSGSKWRKTKKSSHVDEKFVTKDTSAVPVPVPISQVAVLGNGIAHSSSSDVEISLSANEQKMLDDLMGPQGEVAVVTGGQPAVSGSAIVQGAEKRVCKALFPSVPVSGSMELSQQEVLFSEDLGNLLGQEFQTTDHTLGFMDTIMEEQGMASKGSPQEDNYLTDEGGADEGQDGVVLSDHVSSEEVSDVAVDASVVTTQGGAAGGIVPTSQARLVKQKGVLPGASTKKRNMVSLTSPRKKVVAKGGGPNGKFGSHQGGKPPNHSVN
ncbi:PREDICTED: uncharacterized protein LOC104786526 [Camelina sativa]|uniref:Uncharacterized protein LOC104786526 n=1 Tax=Camelina sativa TaxID=90675 RepID=A0ABM0Z4C9_CAMSA|nr:PREDICTED: uncharacterized protein LOC104786526 [Camelina sativa]XP_010510252.1 PREDICTED: uncharacterized protein LOC104786526 [Camelina sativa]